MAKFNRADHEPLSAAREIKGGILCSRNYDYFPHVGVEEIRNGFFKQLHSLQGRRGTYWTSGLRYFEALDQIYMSSCDLVESMVQA